jgi:hypothetical protein
VYAQKPSGSFRIDPVQYDGGNPLRGTFTMTDVKTGRTIHAAFMNKASARVLKVPDTAPTLLLGGLKGIHSDTGSEFINKPAGLRYQKYGVGFSGGRLTHKNNNCYVKQKNYAAGHKKFENLYCRILRNMIEYYVGNII